MKTMIKNLNDLLSTKLKAANEKFFEEKDEQYDSKTKKKVIIDMSVPIESKSRTKYLLYTFDKGKAEDFPNGIFPFFNKVKGANSMCDYMLFAVRNKQLYVLLVELKHGKESTTEQLEAGENFADFIVRTCNRINNKSIIPIVRKISVREKFIQFKRTTKMPDIEYDDNGRTNFEGEKFFLELYLK